MKLLILVLIIYILTRKENGHKRGYSIDVPPVKEPPENRRGEH